tara:strand:- start:56 stop:658 length:603 start_codon:yes stop_codon:yes gene_type:complete
MRILQLKGKKMKKYIYTLIFTMITFSLNAEGFYFGAGLSQSDINQHEYSSLTYTASDDKDTGYRFLIGFDYNERIGVEAVYNDLGQAKKTVDTPQSSETDVQSIALAGVVKSDPINNFTLFGKVGQNLLHAHDKISDGTENGVTEINMYYGLGVSYATTDGIVRLEYEEFGTAGGTDTIRSDRPDQVDPTNISISYTKKF